MNDQWVTAPYAADLHNDPRRHSPARRRVELAVQRLQQAIAAAAEEAEEAREAERQRAHEATAAAVEVALRNGRMREARKDRYVTMDKEWFWAFANEVLADWRSEAAEASSHGRSTTSDYIRNRVEQLEKDLTKIEASNHV
jgi:hypothetical protein